MTHEAQAWLDHQKSQAGYESTPPLLLPLLPPLLPELVPPEQVMVTEPVFTVPSQESVTQVVSVIVTEQDADPVHDESEAGHDSPPDGQLVPKVSVTEEMVAPLHATTHV